MNPRIIPYADITERTEATTMSSESITVSDHLPFSDLPPADADPLHEEVLVHRIASLAAGGGSITVHFDERTWLRVVGDLAALKAHGTSWLTLTPATARPDED